ncbi:hypothetical protein Tco_0777686 [Tanacetum coccineum]
MPYLARSIRRIGLDSLECALRSQSISDIIPNLLLLPNLRIVIFMDTAYGSSQIRRLGNWSNVLSCEVLALTRHISFVRYGFALRSTLSVLTRIDSHTTICGGQDMAPLPATDQTYPWLRYQVEGHTEGAKGSRMSDTKMGLDVADTLCFQLGGVKRRMTWTQFILVLGLHTEQEMTKVGFGAYWDGSDRLIPDKGDLRDYWIEISFDKDFWARTGEAPEKVTSVDTLYLLTWSEGLLTSQHLISAVSLFRHDEREDMQGQLGRLNICSMFGDTLAWVAPGPERQQVTAAGAHEADEAGPTVDEGA